MEKLAGRFSSSNVERVALKVARTWEYHITNLGGDLEWGGTDELPDSNDLSKGEPLKPTKSLAALMSTGPTGGAMAVSAILLGNAALTRLEQSLDAPVVTILRTSLSHFW